MVIRGNSHLRHAVLGVVFYVLPETLKQVVQMARSPSGTRDGRNLSTDS